MLNSKVYIFHFRPLENYPPIQNLLNFLNGATELEKVYCFSTHGQLEKYMVGKKVKIYRIGKVGGNKFFLWISYFVYNVLSLVFLLFKRPSKVMYFESLSAFPVYLYKKYINKNADVYIHYHEYTTYEEYQKASFIERLFHSLEREIYQKAKWISHTNKVRLNKFLTDEELFFDSKIHRIMPNYPSKKWTIQNKKWREGQKLKLIYVGYSLTQEGSYLKEVVSFLKSSEIPIELNIYCILQTDFVKSLEESSPNFTLKLHEALPYNQLPMMLSQHHIGMILYKAKTPNYIYNAPNKLFEYLSCGLDVWYPQEMKGIYYYDSNDTPKVLRLDFNKLERNSLKELIKSSGKINKMTYFAEEVYKKLLNKLMSC